MSRSTYSLPLAIELLKRDNAMPLNIRALKVSDYNEVRAIYEKYYRNEFTLPNFTTHFLGAFVIEDEEGIISVCSLRTLVEAIILTNQDVSVRKRRAALMMGAEALMFIAGQYGYEEIHAFVQDPTWMRHLIKKGFRPTRGESLVTEI